MATQLQTAWKQRSPERNTREQMTSA